MKLIATVLHDVAFILIGDVLGEGRYLSLFGVIRRIVNVILTLFVVFDDSALFLFVGGVLL